MDRPHRHRGPATWTTRSPRAAGTAVQGCTSAGQVVGRLLAVTEVFGPDLIADPVVVTLLTDALTLLTADGARAAARSVSARW